MKKFLMIPGFALAMLAFTGCGDDDENPIDPTDPTDPLMDNVLSGQITEDRTLTADAIWTLDGRVTIVDGVTLTIEPGTIIKGNPGASADAAVLIIARGATIDAEGTAENPIIFTSSTDNIAVGETAGTNLDQNDRGLWGGVVILGNAPISVDGNVEAAQIEGIPADDINGLYGGTDPNDNSGVLSYISIRHGGITLSAGNELNGLTLGGVGSGTTINNIEVVANNDDGVEWFGGTVNVNNVFVWAQADDAIDIDQSYNGTIDNVVVVLGEESDHALEIDGPEGQLISSFTLENATLIGNSATNDGEIADYRSGATGATNNVLVFDFKDSSDVELDNNGVAQNFLDGNLTFSNWQVVLPVGIAAANEVFIEKGGCLTNCEDDDDESMRTFEDLIILTPDFTERAADWTSELANSDAATVGAETSAFGWTYSNTKAGLGF
ncbi:hypothetical protein NBT05_03710 [Aquimarina sp. ERC-38]|uniref:hypothetical protein n=1 Tax=Aquimarina sp. ERC-38 TaxID=2949996 RepID=UPI002247DF80|nr:hypothetical protein [Aquimarina sp. ERC-38]UZO81587.1 hypothetical protein NBT05_03710 [Aquimarina sp. ERC-38]